MAKKRRKKVVKRRRKQYGSYHMSIRDYMEDFHPFEGLFRSLRSSRSLFIILGIVLTVMVVLVVALNYIVEN